MQKLQQTNTERASIKKPRSVDITMMACRYCIATAIAAAAATFTLQMDFFCRASAEHPIPPSEFDYSDECRSTCTTFAPLRFKPGSG